MQKTPLDRYEEIVIDALKGCSAKLRKSFKSAFISAIILYMVLPRKINFIHMGRNSVSCEQRFPKAMRRNIRIVVHYPKTGVHKIYFSTDLDMSAKEIMNYYQTRFQIEFYFCNYKQFTGLNDCQARCLEKLDFAFNESLSAVNVAKIVRIQDYPSLSIGLLKSCMSNI